MAVGPVDNGSFNHTPKQQLASLFCKLYALWNSNPLMIIGLIFDILENNKSNNDSPVV